MLGLYFMKVVENRQADTALRPSLSDLAAFAGALELRFGHQDQARADSALATTLNAKGLKARALKHQVDMQAAPPL
jgi:hypothetical protein